VIDSLADISAELSAGTLREHRHSNVELKESWRDDVGPRLSALANRIDARPGWVVIGVTDDGKIVGRDEKWAKATEEIVSQHLNRFLDPGQSCVSVTPFEISGAWCIGVGVRNPGAVVYWENKAYKRAGTTIEEMKPDEVMELTVKLPGLSDYSKQPWSGHASERQVRHYLEAVAQRQREPAVSGAGERTPGDILRTFGLADRNAARILFGDCKYRLVFYSSDGTPRENETHSGLYDLVGGAVFERIQTWMKQQSGQADSTFPSLALKESLANAVAHAAYFEQDGDVTVEVYPDRLVLSNLCLPESGYFANRWFSRSRKTVNGLLMEALRIAGFVDELGRGKNLIFRESILNGRSSPEVTVEKAGRYDRWRLVLHGGNRNRVQLRLLERLQDIYPDPQKALIANALVIWRSRPLSEVRGFIDGESLPVFAEVLGDPAGPIFYWQEHDRIIIRRWVRVLLDEGKDSKTLTAAEEMDLYEFAYKLRTKYSRGLFSPRELRVLAAMGETASERTVMSKLLKRWISEGRVRKIGRGLYEFVVKPAAEVDYSQLLQLLRPAEEH
jgi:ATP-dependent DNA helicase RecG